MPHLFYTLSESIPLLSPVPSFRFLSPSRLFFCRVLCVSFFIPRSIFLSRSPSFSTKGTCEQVCVIHSNFPKDELQQVTHLSRGSLVLVPFNEQKSVIHLLYLVLYVALSLLFSLTISSLSIISLSPSFSPNDTLVTFLICTIYVTVFLLLFYCES